MLCIVVSWLSVFSHLPFPVSRRAFIWSSDFPFVHIISFIIPDRGGAASYREGRDERWEMDFAPCILHVHILSYYNGKKTLYEREKFLSSRTFAYSALCVSHICGNRREKFVKAKHASVISRMNVLYTDKTSIRNGRFAVYAGLPLLSARRKSSQL